MKNLITQQNVYNFCNMTGDLNRIHLHKDYAEKTRFGQIIAPGMYIASLIPAALVEKYGDGIIYISQTLEFKKPVYLGDIVEVGLTEQEKSGKLITIKSICSVDERAVIEGIAKILIRV